MDSIKFTYDREEDVLYVALRPPYQGQQTVELGGGVVVRLNPETRAVESLTILDLSALNTINIPATVEPESTNLLLTFSGRT